MRRVFLLPLVLAPSIVMAAPAPLSNAKMAALAKPMLNAQLVDYQSARFQNVTSKLMDPKDGTMQICGEVNSRNKLGGMSGWTKFFAFVNETVAGNNVLLFAKPEFDLTAPICGKDPGVANPSLAAALTPKP